MVAGGAREKWLPSTKLFHSSFIGTWEVKLHKCRGMASQSAAAGGGGLLWRMEVHLAIEAVSLGVRV